MAFKKQDVVVLGGGTAGYPAAKALSKGKGLDVTLVDSSEFFEWKPALYSILEGKERNSIGFRFRPRLSYQGIDFVNSLVTAINPEENFVEVGKDEIRYDYLLVALGSEVKTFGLTSEKIHHLHDFSSAKKIREEALQSDSVTIMGGGVTGVETAFTLEKINPDLDITLLEAGKRIASQLREESSRKLHDALERRDIAVRTGQPAERVDGGSVVCSGETFDADFIVQATGVQPAEVVRETFSDEGLRVDEHLRSVKYDNVFGAGDCIHPTNCDKVRRAYHATKEARTISVNMLREATDSRKLKTHECVDAPIILTLGGWESLYEDSRFSFSGLLPHLMHTFGVEKRFIWQYKYFT